jgi:hypothetical protein
MGITYQKLFNYKPCTASYDYSSITQIGLQSPDQGEGSMAGVSTFDGGKQTQIGSKLGMMMKKKMGSKFGQNGFGRPQFGFEPTGGATAKFGKMGKMLDQSSGFGRPQFGFEPVDQSSQPGCKNTRPTDNSNAVKIAFFSNPLGGKLGEECPSACDSSTALGKEELYAIADSADKCFEWPGRSGRNSAKHGTCNPKDSSFSFTQWSANCQCKGTPGARKTFYTSRCVVDRPPTLCAKIVDYSACNTPNLSSGSDEGSNEVYFQIRSQKHTGYCLDGGAKKLALKECANIPTQLFSFVGGKISIAGKCISKKLTSGPCDDTSLSVNNDGNLVVGEKCVKVTGSKKVKAKRCAKNKNQLFSLIDQKTK